MLVPRSVFKLAKISDRESSRYALGSIKFQRDHSGAPWAVATDGRRLLAVTWHEPAGDEFPPVAGVNLDANREVDYLIPAGVAERAARSKVGLKSPKPILHYVGIDENAADGGLVPIVATDLQSVDRFDTRQQEGRFPRWKDVPPAYGKSAVDEDGDFDPAAGGDISVALDSRLLRELLQTIEENTGGDYNRVVLTISGKSPHENAVLLTAASAEGTRAFGVLMPLSFGERDKPEIPAPAVDFHKTYVSPPPAKSAAVAAEPQAEPVAASAPVEVAQSEVDTELEDEPAAATAAAEPAGPSAAFAAAVPDLQPSARFNDDWKTNAAAVVAAVHVA